VCMALKLAKYLLVYSCILGGHESEANTKGFASRSDACEVEKWYIVEIRSICRIDE
jgi:hypothetical protein